MKTTIAALVLAAAAGSALADGPARPFARPGVPVIHADGAGGYRAGGLVNFDMATASSWDLELDPSNDIRTFTVTETTPMTNISWAGTVATRGASWRNEAVIYFGAPDPAQSFYITMGFADGSPGTTSYSGSADIVAALGFAINPAGTWTLEFFESYDDVADAIDADWSNVNIAMVPAPGSVALLGLGALAAGRRRR